MKILKQSKGNVVGVLGKGICSEKELLDMEKKFDALVKKYKKISCLIVMDNFSYARKRDYFIDLAWSIKHLRNFNRLAIVADAKGKKLYKLMDGKSIFGAKLFDTKDLEKAWKYVEGDTKK